MSRIEHDVAKLMDDANSRVGITRRPLARIYEILDQLVTTFYYRKLGADFAEPRKVHPLHLVEVEGGWYLIAPS